MGKAEKEKRRKRRIGERRKGEKRKRGIRETYLVGLEPPEP